MSGGKGAVLITRPVLQAGVFAAELKDLGLELETLVAPLLEVEAVGYEAPDLDGVDGLVFTSVNGVRFFDHADVSRDIPVFAVNVQTRETLDRVGYRDIVGTYGGAVDLEAVLDGRRFLHVRGADVAHEFADHVEGLVAYRARVVEAFDDSVVEAFRAGVVGCVTLFSARTARQFAVLVERYDLTDSLSSIKVLLISDDLVEYVHTYSWADLFVAETPNRQGMIETLKRIYGDE